MSKHEHKKGSGIGKFLAGAAVGAGLGILFAPKSGSETRRDLKNKLDEMIAKVKDIDIEEVKQNIEDKVMQIRLELEDLDKEKVFKIAKQKAIAIKESAEELVDYAIEKGTPVLEKTATAIREKAIQVTEEVLTKLKDKDEKGKK